MLVVYTLSKWRSHISSLNSSVFIHRQNMTSKARDVLNHCCKWPPGETSENTFVCGLYGSSFRHPWDNAHSPYRLFVFIILQCHDRHAVLLLKALECWRPTSLFESLLECTSHAGMPYERFLPRANRPHLKCWFGHQVWSHSGGHRLSDHPIHHPRQRIEGEVLLDYSMKSVFQSIQLLDARLRSNGTLYPNRSRPYPCTWKNDLSIARYAPQWKQHFNLPLVTDAFIIFY